MDMYVRSGDVTSDGNDVSGIGADIADGTRKGRSLEVLAPGLATAMAFGGFRDSWLGQGEKLSIDLSDTGGNVVRSDNEHSTNEDYITRGYDGIRAR